MKTRKTNNASVDPTASGTSDPAVEPTSHSAAGETEPTHVDAEPVETSAEKPQSAACTPDELRANVVSLEDSLLRAKADYQNLQRRSVIERAEAVRYANTELLRSLVGVLDDFDRALEAAKSSENLDAVVDGVRLVRENLVKSLGNAGLEPIESLNQPFDPAVHEAMLQQPTDEHPPGTVIEQVARGYRLGDRVLRPAKVVVARAPD